jgi:hypothetical protein
LLGDYRKGRLMNFEPTEGVVAMTLSDRQLLNCR